MTSETDICNSALSRLGEANLLSLVDDNSANATYCRQFYEDERDFLFRLYPWNFSTKRVTLQREVATPDWEFAFYYKLPNDCVKLLEMQDEAYTKHKIEGRSIVTDLETVKIRYSSIIIDTSQFDKSFIMLLSLRLSAILAYPLTKSNTVTQQMWKLYDEYEMDAMSADGQEGTPDVLEDRSLIDVRL